MTLCRVIMAKLRSVLLFGTQQHICCRGLPLHWQLWTPVTNSCLFMKLYRSYLFVVWHLGCNAEHCTWRSFTWLAPAPFCPTIVYGSLRSCRGELCNVALHRESFLPLQHQLHRDQAAHAPTIINTTVTLTTPSQSSNSAPEYKTRPSISTLQTSQPSSVVEDESKDESVSAKMVSIVKRLANAFRASLDIYSSQAGYVGMIRLSIDITPLRNAVECSFWG